MYLYYKNYLFLWEVKLMVKRYKVDCPSCGARGRIRKQRPAWEEVEYGPKYITCPRCQGQKWIIITRDDGLIDMREKSF